MRITGIIWLEEIVEKLWRKHQVTEDEVTEMLGSRPRFRFVAKGHREGDDLYSALGRTDAGRFLIAFFLLKHQGQALIVSAREMTPTERKRYEH